MTDHYTIARLRGALTRNGRMPRCVPQNRDGELVVDDGMAAEDVAAFRIENGRLPRSITLPGHGSWAVHEAPGEPTSPVDGKVVVVTGGAQGFGAGIAQELVDGGAYVIIADLNMDGARDFAARLNERRNAVVAQAVHMNVTDEVSVRQSMHTVAAIAGGFDLFVSNAGVLKAGSVKEMSKTDFEFVTQVNYSGFFLCTKHASTLLAAQRSGIETAKKRGVETGEYYADIVQVNSKSGLSGSNKNSAYAGAKFGSIGLVQSFALELISDGVKVNAVCPGNFFDGPLWSDPERGLFVQYLETGKVPGAKTIDDVKSFYEAKVPMGRGCTPEDVAKAIVYLVDQVYETGQALPVTGGQIMLH